MVGCMPWFSVTSIGENSDKVTQYMIGVAILHPAYSDILSFSTHV